MTLELLLAFLLAGVAAGGLAIWARALPWPEAWKRRKPLACPACMGGWSSFVTVPLVVIAHIIPGGNTPIAALAWLFSTGVAACMFAYVNPPMIELPGEDLRDDSSEG